MRTIVLLAAVMLAAYQGPGRGPAVMVFGDSHAFALAAVAGHVVNAGVPSERASALLRDGDQISGQERIKGVLQARPAAIVIMAGANDVFEGTQRTRQAGEPEAVWLMAASEGVLSIVLTAKRAGIPTVLVGIPVQRPDGARARGRYDAGIRALNVRMQAIADAYAVPFVPAYDLTAQDMVRYVSDDDVHLTPAGNAMLWHHVRSALREVRR